jgi:eukaryotic-like serine/threonine-protein kinase
MGNVQAWLRIARFGSLTSRDQSIIPELMALTVGTRLGVYEIVAPLGEGGMGVVYRATDTKLSRQVAIKVLPGGFAQDADRMARFEREARLLAALNHPNIATIYAVESGALVMELVEGATLAERVRQGTIPMDEALLIAKQIADALEAAHQKTIIHRDLKPANIMITPAGVVKVLDFGLAKITAPEAAQPPEQSPTLTLSATRAGIILGTALYMAPEQARGKPVDKRADIWAFGCVLYEMLSGRKAFDGESTTEILAAVLKSEPDWSALPRDAPPNVLRVLRHCLAKDPARRLHDIADARLELAEEIAVEPSAPRRSAVRWWAAAAACLVAGFAAGVWWQNTRAPREVRWTGERLGGSLVAMGPRVSPDGQLLAFQAMVNGITQVAVLKPASGNWAVLTHEESKGFVYDISWSSDGAKLYYSRMLGLGGDVYSVPVLGGDERLLLENAGLPAMLPDGSLLVSRRNADRQDQLHRYWPETGRIQPLKALIRAGAASPAYRVSPSGDRVVFAGTPIESPDAPRHLYALDLRTEKVTRLAPGQSIIMITPFALAVSADGRSVLFTSTDGDLHRIVSVPIDGSAGERTLFTQTASTGFLDVGTDGSIYADQWDRPRQVVRFPPSGGPVEQIGESLDDLSGFQATALQDGRVVYSSRVAGRRRLLVAGAGKDPVPLVETQEETSTPAAAVGGGQIAFVIGTSSNQAIGLASIANGRIIRRLEGTASAAISGIAAFPDGQTIYYTAARSVWSIPTAGGEPKRLGAGDSVTVDPVHHELIVRLDEKDRVSLVKMPLTGAPVRPIPLAGDVHLVSDGALSATAVGKDGRILVQAAAGSMWTWPVGLLNPETGSVQILKFPYPADMPTPGWSPDGKVVVVAEPIRSSLWRFRPAN